jgi:hypothetical protein
MNILDIPLRPIGHVDEYDNAAFIQDHMCIPRDRYKRLYHKFPNDKYILTVRKTPEIWVESIKNRSIQTYSNHAIRRQRASQYGYEMPHGKEKYFRNFYIDHNQEVRTFFLNKGNFLEICIDTDDVWGKLCPFIHKPIPDIQYPHKNKSKKIIRYANRNVD